MNADLLQGFYLGDLVVEPLKGHVIGRAGSRHLPPKAVEVLLCLARTPGEIVTRETLIEDAWGADSGSHEALSHAVGEIRHALDDQVDNPTFIQTLPRRGYRLVVEPTPAILDESSIIIGAQGGASVDDIGLFENLKRRGVFETALAYLIVGWLLIQVGDIVFAQLHMPVWAGTFVTVLVIAGFPIAIALSWFLDFRHGHAVVDDLSVSDLRRRRFSRTYLSVVSSLAIAAFMVYVYDRIIGLPAPETPVTAVAERQLTLPPVVENSIAVLPFASLNGHGETQLFADGLVEDVITQLTRVPGLRVASRGDSYALQPNSTSKEVRRRLRVERYLEGSVEMSSDEIRVTVQLINSDDGFHILSRRFDRPREDFFELRDEITNLTVANVRVALPPKSRASSLKVAENPSVSAYVLYQRGIEASRQPKTIDTIASALVWFDAALNVDPEYAAAHAGKCAVYVDGYTEIDDQSYMDSAESSCATALTLNPNLDIVHTSLGDLYQSTGRLNDAEAAYLQALSIDPSNVAALTGLGKIYRRLKRLDEAEAKLRKAVDIHPGDTSAYNALGTFLFRTGRYGDAAIQYEFLVALEPNDMLGVSNLASAYMLKGDFAAAIPTFEKAIAIKPTKSAYSNLGVVYFYLGDFDSAIESHTNAIELQPNDYLGRSNLGDTFRAAGRTDDARREFEMAKSMATAALNINPNDPLVLMDLAWIKTSLAEHTEARKLIDRSKELTPDDPYVHYIDGLILNRLGDTEGAAAALRAAVERGYPVQLLAGDPNLSNLRSTHFNDITDVWN